MFAVIVVAFKYLSFEREVTIFMAFYYIEFSSCFFHYLYLLLSQEQLNKSQLVLIALEKAYKLNKIRKISRFLLNLQAIFF